MNKYFAVTVKCSGDSISIDTNSFAISNVIFFGQLGDEFQCRFCAARDGTYKLLDDN